MKKFILLTIISAAALGTSAQTSKSSVGAYGAGITEITWINGKPALNVGAYGGVLINHKFLIGAAGSNILFRQTVSGKKEKFQFNYYGLHMEYRFMPEKTVHLSAGLTGAMGWQENDLMNAKKSRKRDGDFTYVIQPKIALNVKIARFMQVQVYGSYRFTGNTHSQFYTEKNYNGASGGIGLVFGSF